MPCAGRDGCSSSASLLAALGWGLDTQTKVETDITKLVPQSLGSLSALNTLERETGVGGEVAVLVSGENLTKASTIAWMTEYQAALLKRFGYSNGRGCGQSPPLPGLLAARPLPDPGGDTRGRRRRR